MVARVSSPDFGGWDTEDAQLDHSASRVDEESWGILPIQDALEETAALPGRGTPADEAVRPPEMDLAVSAIDAWYRWPAIHAGHTWPSTGELAG